MNDEPRDDDSTPHSRPDSRKAWEDLERAVKDVLKAGSEDARKAFRRAAPHARDEFARGLHDLSYGVAWLTHFGAAMIRQASPDNLAEGWEEGARAGRSAAKDWAERAKRRARRETDDHLGGDPEGNDPVAV